MLRRFLAEERRSEECRSEEAGLGVGWRRMERWRRWDLEYSARG